MFTLCSRNTPVTVAYQLARGRKITIAAAAAAVHSRPVHRRRRVVGFLLKQDAKGYPFNSTGSHKFATACSYGGRDQRDSAVDGKPGCALQ